MKNITIKVRLNTHDKMLDYALIAGAKRGKRMPLAEAYDLVVEAGLKALKFGQKKSKKT